MLLEEQQKKVMEINLFFGCNSNGVLQISDDVNCTPESGHKILQLPWIVDSESATWTSKVHDTPTL